MSRCTCGARWSGTTAQHCPVAGCHETFSGETAGNMHRVGGHAVSLGPNRRRCLTADEMLAKGMKFFTNAHGTWIWTTGRVQEPRFRAFRQESDGLSGTPEGEGPGTGLAPVLEMDGVA